MRDPRIDRAVGLCTKLVGCFSYSWRQKKVLEQIPAISHVISSDRKARHVAGFLKFSRHSKILSVLLTDFTDALSGGQHVCISSTKLVLNLFKTVVVAVQEDDLDLTPSIKSKILGYLQKKYSDPNTQELLDIATSLDPRFKTSGLNP